MGKNTAISWTDSTFNPWRGCTKVSAGCTNCYAEQLSGRNPAVLGEWGPNGTRVLASLTTWKEVEAWHRGMFYLSNRLPGGRNHRVFCASLADVFEDWPGQMVDSRGRPLAVSAVHPKGYCIDPVWIGAEPYTMDHARRWLWELIRATPRLDWLLLTKRPENIARMLPAGEWPNVWLGVSVENQDNVWRVDCLLNESIAHVEVAHRFVSAEPLLGPIDFGSTLGPGSGEVNWVIVGGESGSGSRLMEVEWARSILQQCRAADAAPFIKQLGKVPMIYKEDDEGVARLTLLPMLDGKGGLLSEFPEDLQVREFPNEHPHDKTQTRSSR